MGERNKNRKIGRIRKTAQNLRYKNEHRHEKSHIKRITKHLRRFPADKVAETALRTYKYEAGVISAKPA